MTVMLQYLPYVEAVILSYFVVLNGTYLMLNVLAIGGLHRYMQSRDLVGLPELFPAFAPPVSIIVPAYNEAGHILDTIRSLLDQNYPTVEIIVVNDGSTDDMMEVLREHYRLVPFPEAYRARIATQPVWAIYRSTTQPNLRIIDKDNGGRGDAVNAGINAARYPLFCCVDADSLLQKNSIHLIVQPFLEDPAVVASGGTVRVANDCETRDGLFVRARLSRNPVVLFQIIEYLRAFLYGRLGWALMNGQLIISGAFGLFHKETVVSVGGYRDDTLGEDMELIIRMHRLLCKRDKPYRITFIADPICWTHVPSSLGRLMRQRIRWHIGHIESLLMNRKLLFSRGSGPAGWISFPFSLFFEWFGPVIEVIGYAIIIAGFILGFVTPEIFVIFLVVAIGFGILLSVSALLLEEISFRLYPRPRHIFALFLVAILENFGYRQLNSLWRIAGIYYFLFDAVRRRLGKPPVYSVKRYATGLDNPAGP